MTEEVIKALGELVREGGTAAIWVALVMQIKGIIFVLGLGVVGTFVTHTAKFWIRHHYEHAKSEK